MARVRGVDSVKRWFDPARRVTWVVGDQALSSLTNFILGALVARAVSVEDFGVFAIVFTTYSTALGVSRALATEPFIIRYPAADPERWSRGVRASSGTALAVGVTIGIVTALAGAVIAGTLGAALVILGALLPGLLVQDCWRFVFFARRMGAAAFLNDLLWAAVLIPAILTVVWTGHGTIGWLVVAWGGAGAAGAVFGVVQSRAWPQPQQAIRWLRDERDLASRFFGELAVRSLGGQLGTYGIGAVAGLAAVGALRASDMLLGPINIISLAVGLAGVSEFVLLAKSSLARLQAGAVILSAVMAGVVVVWGGIALFLPSSIGTQILGASWYGARALLLPLALAQVAASAFSGPMTGLRALAAAQRGLRLRIVLSIMSLTSTVAAAAVGGVMLAAWTMAAMGFLSATLWWIEFRREIRAQARSREAAAEATRLGVVRTARP